MTYASKGIYRQVNDSAIVSGDPEDRLLTRLLAYKCLSMHTSLHSDNACVLLLTVYLLVYLPMNAFRCIRHCMVTTRACYYLPFAYLYDSALVSGDPSSGPPSKVSNSAPPRYWSSIYR